MKRYYFIFLIVLLIIATNFYISKKSAENIAVKYMEINKIYNDESYQEVKSKIYDISSDDVKNTLFKSDNYPLDDRNPINYEIHSVKSDYIGFNNYIVYIDFTANNCMRLTSVFEVVDGVVKDSYRANYN
jgi:hypothetical protein